MLSDVATANFASWMDWDTEEASLAAAKAINENATSEEGAAAFEKAFGKRISFGTAGLRGRMAPGLSNMNLVTVGQATWGLALYLKKEFGEEGLARGVAVGRDARHNSVAYAEITRDVFLHHGFNVYYFKDFVPTPMVPFAVREKSCVCGIVVTASHNPKDDNGYKVYWETSSQIVPPHDKGIAGSINDNCCRVDPTALETSNAKVIDPTHLIDEYFAKIKATVGWSLEKNSQFPHKVVYTPMHGVGGEYVHRVVREFGFPELVPVPSQALPDPEFPTVAFPNPEEKGALNASLEAAEASGAKLIIANDPDADRLAVAEKKEDGSWHTFSGNELGILLGHWVWIHRQHLNPHGRPDNKLILTNTTVSSRMLGALAKVEGAAHFETLTGFKYMGALAVKMEKEGFTTLFGFEEAIGTMIADWSLDKDGIRAAVAFLEMANKAASEGKSVLDHYHDLEAKYGVFLRNNSYFFTPGAHVNAQVFEVMRASKVERDPSTHGDIEGAAGATLVAGSSTERWPGSGGVFYPAKIGPFTITRIRDVKSGYDSMESDHKAVLPIQSSDMVTFWLSGGGCIHLRGSGTEPKLKFYIEVGGSPGESKTVVQERLDTLVSSFLEEIMKPERFGLKPPVV